MNIILLFAICFIAPGMAEIGTTDEDEVFVIKNVIELLANDSCEELAEDIGYFCCASKVILGVFERAMGLKSTNFCQIHETVCHTKNCEAQTSGSCSPASCPPRSEKELKLEEMILSQQYSDQQILEMLLPDLNKIGALKGPLFGQRVDWTGIPVQIWTQIGAIWSTIKDQVANVPNAPNLPDFPGVGKNKGKSL